jgi:DNA-binding transcriptional LysR family regulator
MDLNHIATFIRVVETRSFTAAAQALGVPKSSVSRSLARLEEELGARLLQRTTRKLSLTDAGHAYFARVQTLMSGIDEANAEVSELGQSAHGTVRVTAPVDLGVLVLADILVQFSLQYPKIHVDLVLTSRMVSLVEEGFDIALRAGKLTDSSLVARKLAVSEFGVFAAKAYLKKHPAPQHPTDLAQHDCILFRGSKGRSTWTLSGPDGQHDVNVGGVISVDDMAFVKRAARGGLGIALLPLFGSSEEATASGLVRVLPQYSQRGAPIHLVMPSAQFVPTRVALLRDFIIEGAKTVKWHA